MSYVDGYVLPVPTENLKAYLAMAKKCAKVWKEHGALMYVEAVADDVAVPGFAAFPKMAKTKPGETVVFAFVLFKSKTHRNQVNKKVMNDPRLNDMCDDKAMPFDLKRMAYGGFKVAVSI